MIADKQTRKITAQANMHQNSNNFKDLFRMYSKTCRKLYPIGFFLTNEIYQVNL